MPRCLIGLGANVGPRQQTLEAAIHCLRTARAVRVIACSRSHRTVPAGGPAGQGCFLNAAAMIETTRTPRELLLLLQRIEHALGRRAGVRWGPRPIDLDLLLYADRVIDEPALQVPHPRMAWRRFVLEPAAEIAPALVHPTTGWTLARLVAHLDQTPPYVAIAGPIGVGKTRLAQAVAAARGWRWIAEPLDLPRLQAFYADPAGSAWSLEIEFLEQRAGLLATVDDPAGAVSDFWFEQSLAFAGVWLAPQAAEVFRDRFEVVRRHVARPRLLVLLDAPPEVLQERIRQRGRSGEERLTRDQLQRIRQALRRQAALPDQGPVMHVRHEDFQRSLHEVLGALDAMR